MMKTLSIIIGIIIIAAVGGFVFWQKQSSLTISVPQTDASTTLLAATSSLPQATTTTNATTVKSIADVDVSAHNSRESCWSTINGNVYDLTAWIPQHPGGEEAILQLCGTDGSEKFNRQHGGGPRQAAILAGFKIGVLAQ